MKCRNKLQLQKVAVKGKTTKMEEEICKSSPKREKGKKGKKQNSIIGLQNHTTLLH